MPPGLVSVKDAPCKSSAVSLLSRDLRTRSSYFERNAAKSRASALLITGTTRKRVPSLRSLSTASPRWIPGSSRAGAPVSSRRNENVIAGISRAARTSAYATTWVNEIFSLRPAALIAPLSSLRRASSTSTGTARKLVAVGIVRLCSMYPISAAGGPLIGTSLASGGRGGSGAPAVAAAARCLAVSRCSITSPRRISPFGPEPLTNARSTSSRSAIRRAGRSANVSPRAAAGAEAFVGTAGGAAAARERAGLPAGRGALTSIVRSLAPTATVSPARTKISAIAPDCGAGISTSTLSVVTSSSGSPSATYSPGLRRSSTTDPSVTDSPISGRTTSIVSTGPLRGGAPLPFADTPVSAPATAPLPLDVSISARTAPTRTTSPAPARISAIVPEAVAGTSTSTLSVVTSTRASPALTKSPTCLRHSTIEPSVTDSPISGRVTLIRVSATISLPCSCHRAAAPPSAWWRDVPFYLCAYGRSTTITAATRGGRIIAARA